MFILQAVKALCFDTLLQVLILHGLGVHQNQAVLPAFFDAISKRKRRLMSRLNRVGCLPGAIVRDWEELVKQKLGSGHLRRKVSGGVAKSARHGRRPLQVAANDLGRRGGLALASRATPARWGAACCGPWWRPSWL